jgi:hypothetical protein
MVGSRKRGLDTLLLGVVVLPKRLDVAVWIVTAGLDETPKALAARKEDTRRREMNFIFAAMPIH